MVIKTSTLDYPIEQTYAEAFKDVSIDFGRPMAPQIYALLRSAIIQNRLEPRTPIYEAKLGEILGVSRTPLRAAMQQLVKERLVETRPQVGSMVAPIDKKKIVSAVFCRSALETAVVRKLAAMDNPNLDRLNDVMRAQARCTDRDDYIAFFDLDEEFHARLAELSGVAEAWQLVLSNKTHVDRARLRLQSAIPGRASEAFAEHEAIVEALRNKDGELAAELMDRHVHTALDVITQSTEAMR